MKQFFSILAGLVSLLAFAAVLVWFCWRCLKRSDEESLNHRSSI
jgi:membrane protein implicated in regulation of membrane protease activity